MKLLLIGHSHIRAIWDGYRESPPPGISCECINLLSARYRSADDDEALEQIRADVLNASANVDAVVLSLSGNEHNVLGLVASDRPFDCILPDVADDQADPSCELIPVDLVRETLERITTKRFHTFFAGLFARPAYALSPPPPIFDSGYIAAHPGFFKDLIPVRGISPPPIRLKLWKLYCAILRRWSAEAGFGFVEVPETNLDSNGYLHPEALNGDPTHGNAWYGKHMIDHLRQQIGSPSE